MKSTVAERATYTVDEAASRLGVNRKTIYEGVRAGELPGIKLGARVLIPKIAFDRLCEEGRKTV